MTTPPSGDDPPKIIIDEDWKSQAQAEKERLEQSRAGAPGSSAAPSPTAQSSTGQPSAGSAQPAPRARPRAPAPPSLALLATSIATQALVALGLAFDPGHPERTEPDLDQARHLIDTLQMLQDKTAGNRTAEEDAVLGDLLHEMRMAFVSVQTPPPRPRGDEPSDFGMSA